jgi:hypothetical protein
VKNIILLFFFLLLRQIAFPKDTICKPSLLDIYDYSIGDTYIYKYTSIDFAGSGTGSPIITYYFDSFKITDKIMHGDSLIYTVEGSLPPTSVTRYDFEPFQIRMFIDTLIIIDSVKHNLNKCADSLMKFSFPQADDIFSKVIIDERDSITIKSFGGMNNLFYYNGNEYTQFWDFEYEEKYSDGLGLYYQYFSFGEYSDIVELAGFVKNGDTTVIISSHDPVKYKNNLLTYPNPVTDRFHIQFQNGENINSIKIFDSLGKNVFVDSNPSVENIYSLDFSDFNDGIYFLLIETNEQQIVKKIIKHKNGNYY